MVRQSPYHQTRGVTVFFQTNEKSVRTNTPLVSLSSSVNDNFLIVLGLGWSATRRGASSALLVLANQCFYALQHLFQFKNNIKKKKIWLLSFLPVSPRHLLSSVHVKVHGLIYMAVIYPINNLVLSLCLLAFYWLWSPIPTFQGITWPWASVQYWFSFPVSLSVLHFTGLTH